MLAQVRAYVRSTITKSIGIASQSTRDHARLPGYHKSQRRSPALDCKVNTRDMYIAGATVNCERRRIEGSKDDDFVCAIGVIRRGSRGSRPVEMKGSVVYV